MRTPMILASIVALSFATATTAARAADNPSTMTSPTTTGHSVGVSANQLPRGESQINLDNGCQITFFQNPSNIPSGSQQVQIGSSCQK